MNRERLNKLIDIYIDKFDFLNDVKYRTHFESMKWRAIHHYKTNFDINAPDFYGMFQNAMSMSDVIINNGNVQPVNGILKLISHEENTMRNLFAMLYEEDGGDINKRQDRIERFVDEANKLLDKYEFGRWRYKQDFRSVLAYLTFYKPEENYLYKSSQCQPFFRYLEYGEEIGYGQYFKLSRYYNMCDEIRNELSKREDLIETHNKRWETVGNPEDDLHILTFDIIYCSIAYNFYEFQNYATVRHKTNAERSRELLVTEIKKLRAEYEALEADLTQKRQALGELSEIHFEGIQVKHRMYGKGQIIKQRGSLIDVSFAREDATFLLPKAFTEGFLTSDDTSILEQCKALENAKAACYEVEHAIKLKQLEIDSNLQLAEIPV